MQRLTPQQVAHHMQRLKERCRWGKEVLEADVRALRARSKFICQELARNNAELIHGGTSRCGVEELEASVRALSARFRATYRSLARKEARLKQIDAAHLAHQANDEHQSGPCSVGELEAGLTGSASSQSPPADFTPEASECGSDESAPTLLSDSALSGGEEEEYSARCAQAVE